MEHGHWHDDPNFHTNSTLENNFIKPNTKTLNWETKNSGKVWNNDHGHYHDNLNQVNN